MKIAGLALALQTAGAASAMDASGEYAEPESVVAELLERSKLANAALLRGDLKTYRSLLTIADDFTLMSPFGGTPSHASSYTDEVWEEIARFFRNGSLEQEVVKTYASADMITLVVVEKADVEVGDLPPQPWALRVTLVYRRERDDWQLVHRHADPLAPGISVEMAARLARGDMKTANNGNRERGER